MKINHDDNEDSHLEQLICELNCILNSRKTNKSTDTRKELCLIARDRTSGIFTANVSVLEVHRSLFLVSRTSTTRNSMMLKKPYSLLRCK
eukprot:2242057-Ditylum_brightwellii.AAC.1